MIDSSMLKYAIDLLAVLLLSLGIKDTNEF